MNVITTKKRVIAGALAILFVAPVFGGTPKLIRDNASENAALSMDADPFFKKSLEEETPSTIKIYNSEDELIYESTRMESDSPDAKLIRLLNKSDYLTSYDKISYFRLNE